MGTPIPHNLPLISIGVTTFDRPKLLKECIASILAQTYQNIEIIIANDFIETPVTFESLSLEPDDRVRIINHSKNIGAYKNNQFLVEVASGDWFTWLADDDLMHPKFLEITHSVFSANAVNSVFTNYVAAASPDGLFPKPVQSTKPCLMKAPEFIDAYTSRNIRTVGSYGVFRRDLFEQFSNVPRFGTGLPVYGDTFIPILAAARGPLAYVDLDLIFLRTHTNSRSASSSKLEDYASAQRDFMNLFKVLSLECLSVESSLRQVKNMVEWFATDSWAVTCRGRPGSIRRIAIFSCYAINILLPMVNGTSKLHLVVYLCKMALADSLRRVAEKQFRRLGLIS
jgi:glycosyltransferase involved in cell wall biosynthesis